MMKSGGDNGRARCRGSTKGRKEHILYFTVFPPARNTPPSIARKPYLSTTYHDYLPVISQVSCTLASSLRQHAPVLQSTFERNRPKAHRYHAQKVVPARIVLQVPGTRSAP